MATIPAIEVTIIVEEIRGRIVRVGAWSLAWECAVCGDISKRFVRPSVCFKCGIRWPRTGAQWRQVVARLIRVKTGFFFWQYEERFEKKVS